MLCADRAQFDLARRLRRDSAAIGEIFSFLSGLYFRGKLAYANTFAAPPRGTAGALVITPHRGLIPADTMVTLEELRAFASVPIDVTEPRFTERLCASAESLRRKCSASCEIVLLGSIATGKYVDCLLPIFGERLLFPAEFVGRGDMSRGGLLLRNAKSGVELDYIPIAGAIRRGSRPPKLPPQPRLG